MRGATIHKDNAKRVGIVGYGQTGVLHIDAISASVNAELVGIVGRDPIRLQKFASERNTRFFLSVEALYKNCAPEFLIICLPILQMRSILEQALEFPWKILVEKPFGYNYRENLEVLRKVKSQKSLVNVAMNRRMLPSSLGMKTRLDIQQEPRLIQVFDQQDTNKAIALGFSREIVQNWHQANSIHMLDLGLSYTRGTMIDIQALQGIGTISSDVRAELKFSSGDVLLYSGLWNEERRWSVKIESGSHKYELEPIEKFNVLCNCCKNLKCEFSAFIEPRNLKPGFYNQILAFLGLRKDLEGQLCSPDQANLASKVLCEIYGS